MQGSISDGVLTKKEKGRWKKLSRRAAILEEGKQLSGVVRPEEWQELADLARKTNEPIHRQLSPRVGFRGGSTKQVEGADHRDILHWLLEASSNVTKNNKNTEDSITNRKRKRQDDTAAPVNLPSWTNLHNPFAAESIGILEIHHNNDVSAIQRRVERLLVENSNYETTICPTRWFQGKSPCSPSRALMYLPERNHKSKNRSKRIENMTELCDELVTLCLTREQLKTAGYVTLEEPQSKKHTPEPVQSQPLAPTDMTLSEAQELIRDYTVPTVVDDSREGLPPYVHAASPDAAASTRQPRILAVDCEMVETIVGIELARVTLVELVSLDQNKLLWDCLVVPQNRVIDYVTRYSGMTRQILDQATLRLEQIQAALLTTVTSKDILIGHSLENDLCALRFVHHRVVDTAVLFQPSHGRFKYSLKMLSATLLKRHIQNPQRPHCSEEDASAALSLAVRRAVEGPSFGINENALRNQVVKVDKSVFVGPAAWLQTHVTSQPNGAHALQCERVTDHNRKAFASWLTGPNRRARLVWANVSMSDADNDSSGLEEMIHDVLEKLPPSSLLLLVGQQGYEQAESMTQQRRARSNPKSTFQWTTQEEERWTEAVESSKMGFAVWVSRTPSSCTTRSKGK